MLLTVWQRFTEVYSLLNAFKGHFAYAPFLYYAYLIAFVEVPLSFGNANCNIPFF